MQAACVADHKSVSLDQLVAYAYRLPYIRVYRRALHTATAGASHSKAVPSIRSCRRVPSTHHSVQKCKDYTRTAVFVLGCHLKKTFPNRVACFSLFTFPGTPCFLLRSSRTSTTANASGYHIATVLLCIACGVFTPAPGLSASPKLQATQDQGRRLHGIGWGAKQRRNS